MSGRRAKDGTRDDDALLSEAQIAVLFGVSRQCIWQDKRRALKKIRAGIMADPVLRQFVADLFEVQPERPR